jgi:hypothetical protein
MFVNLAAGGAILTRRNRRARLLMRRPIPAYPVLACHDQRTAIVDRLFLKASPPRPDRTSDYLRLGYRRRFRRVLNQFFGRNYQFSLFDSALL